MLLFLAALPFQFVSGQSLSINTDGSVADASALLDVKTIAKGILIPRLTEVQRLSIVLPATSLMVYQTNNVSGYYYNAGTPAIPDWKRIVSGTDIYWERNGNHIYNINTGYVGIGINAPLARLHVVDSTVIFSSAGGPGFTPGYLPISGAGRRMLWYPHKAAFRAGHVTGSNWDEDSIGVYSVSLGYDNKARALGSLALGYETTASGAYSTAMGNGTIASGFGASAIGSSTKASGTASTAMGTLSTASGSNSLAMGNLSTAAAVYSVAIGNNVIANSWNSISLGRYNDTIVTISNTWIPTEPLLIVGNGSDLTDKKNALVILKNGNTGIGTNMPLARLHVTDSSTIFSAPGQGNFTPGYLPVSGAGRRMIWYAHKAAFRAGYVNGNNWDEDSIGTYSVSLGYDNKATQFCSFALGHMNAAIGDHALALGSRTLATGVYSTSMGRQTTATGDFASTAMGMLTTASGESSTSMGRNTSASGYASTALGMSTMASGDRSTSMGTITLASGFASTSMGANTIASGEFSTSMGRYSSALGNYTTAMGSSTAVGNYSVAIGESVTANSLNSISLGRHNDTIVSVSYSWIPTEPLLIIGNGTGTTDKRNALVILKNGNTGLGINSPNAPLAFANTTGNKISFYESGLNSQYGLAVQAGQLQMYSDAPAARLSFGYYNSGLYTERMYLDNSTGILNVAGTNYPSDTRYKKQITLLQNPLEKIMAINGVEYLLRTDEFPSKNFGDQLQIGLLAQEVEKVLPQVVHTGTDGYKAIDYAKIVPLLVEAIKEQQRQIDGMKKQLAQTGNK